MILNIVLSAIVAIALVVTGFFFGAMYHSYSNGYSICEGLNR